MLKLQNVLGLCTKNVYSILLYFMIFTGYISKLDLIFDMQHHNVYRFSNTGEGPSIQIYSKIKVNNRNLFDLVIYFLYKYFDNNFYPEYKYERIKCLQLIYSYFPDLLYFIYKHFNIGLSFLEIFVSDLI